MRARLLSVTACAALAAGGCAGGETERVAASMTGGEVERGRTVIATYECGVCHTIPGVRGARGVVGPPLAGFAHRSFIGGSVPNSATDLVRWLLDPPALDPRTAMPDLGLDDQEARDAAAYLYTLR